ncbi:MAG: hypothetical protein HC876_01100 [Chloroflexaceae bacterium]|nr:hypothetical protein [Chloroflexaceae bacterium]NJO04232.1 hypothetical protein [Chloroflexaceae bacterium]
MMEQPACRVGATEDDLARETDRAVLYGAVMAVKRPGVRLKPAIAEAALQLAPAVQAFLEGRDDDQAAYALAYARACGAEAFLRSKRTQ